MQLIDRSGKILITSDPGGISRHSIRGWNQRPSARRLRPATKRDGLAIPAYVTLPADITALAEAKLLPDLIRQGSKYVNGRYSTRFIGRLWGDRPMLVENSPARRAKDVGIPILLVHGDRDLSVEIDQSIEMAKKLDKYDKDFEFIRLEGGDHHLSQYVHRLQFLEETGRFLEQCLSDP